MITEETYKWVEELLDPKVTEISIAENDRLIKNYFRESKTDWYTEENIKKNWDEKKVKQFWELLRKFKVKKRKSYTAYDFSNFIFPTFQVINKKKIFESFWGENEEKIFHTHVTFNRAIFLDRASFYGVKFMGNVNFSNLKSDNNLSIRDCKFEGEIYFNNSYLSGLFILRTVVNKKILFFKSKILGPFYLSEVEFKQAFYLDQMIINGEFTISSNCSFFNEVNLSDSVFHDNIFIESSFYNKVDFYQTNFKKLANFEAAIFYNNISFENSVFLKDAYFNRCVFHETVSFEGADFSGLTLFIDTEFKKEVSFDSAEFKGDTNFFRTTFLGFGNFNNTIFLDSKKIFFMDLKGNPLKLSFKNTIFSKEILFRKINFTNTTFLESDLTDIKFRECEWGENARIILYDEKSIDTKVKSQLKSLEVLYRQLKKNFDATKSWELSGKAYVSEMKMRQRRLWLEKKYYQWFIYWFYDLFGGYTQDFRKPMVSLLCLILVFSGLYFFIDYDIIKALQRGIKGALPYMQIDTENPFQGYWLILRNLQLVLGGTFLAFFVLALRKRFKQ